MKRGQTIQTIDHVRTRTRKEVIKNTGGKEDEYILFL